MNASAISAAMHVLRGSDSLLAWAGRGPSAAASHHQIAPHFRGRLPKCARDMADTMSRVRHGSGLGWIAGALCGAVGLLTAAAPMPTIAQSSTTYSTILVSNYSASGRVRVTDSQALAQPFRTGNVGDGYTLSAVRLKFSLQTGVSAQVGDEIPGDQRVSAVSGGSAALVPSTADPSHVVVRLLTQNAAGTGPTETGAITLINPPTLRSSHEFDGWNLFAAPPGTTLTKQTTYYIEVSHDISGAMIPWTGTETNRMLGQSGWSMSRFLVRNTSGTTWGNGGGNHLLLVNISGSVNNPPEDTSSAPITNLRMRLNKTPGTDPSYYGANEVLRPGYQLWIYNADVTNLDSDGITGLPSSDFYSVPGSMENFNSIAEVISSGMLLDLRNGEHVITNLEIGRRIVPCSRWTDGENNFNHVCGPPTSIIRALNVDVEGTADNADSDMTRISFTIPHNQAAPSNVNRTVNWQTVVGNGTREATGTVNFAARDTERSATANFQDQLRPDSMIEIQPRPSFAASGRSVASSVVADTAVEAGAETVSDVSSQAWVRAGLQQIPSSRTATDFAATSMLSTFGRIASTRLVETIWSRVEAHRHGVAASHASLDGRPIDTTAYASGASARQAAGETAKLFGIEVTGPALASTSDSDGGSVAKGKFEDFASWAGLPGGSGIPGGTSFALPQGDGKLGSIVYWGETNLSDYKSELSDREFSILASDGAISTYNLGIDYRFNKSKLLGLAVSRSSGKAEYSFADSSDGSGDISSSLTMVTPWLHWKSPSGVEVWSAVGAGFGTADGSLNGSQLETDTRMWTAAIGAWNPITTIEGISYAAKADVFIASVYSEGVSVVVDDSDPHSRRFRLAAEVSSERATLAGEPLPFAIEIGARHDGGDAENGFGVDVAGRFIHGSSQSSISMSGRGGMTLYHGQRGFSEIGLGLSVDYDSGANARGFLFSLEPTWNAPRSNVDNLMWDIDSLHRPDPSPSAGAAVRTRLGYGVSALGNFALATLYGEAQSEEDGNRMRLGYEIGETSQRAGSLRFDLYGELRNSHDGAAQAVMLEGGLDF